MGGKHYPDFGERMVAMSLLSIGLAHALQGLANAGMTDEAKEIADQLLKVAKRTTWLECSSDPNWTPRFADGRPVFPKQSDPSPT